MLGSIHEQSKIRLERGKLPESIQVCQDRSEYPVKVLVRHIAHEKTAVRYNNVRIDDDQEILEENDGSSTETIRAKYVIACDGAHSWTRRQLNIPMVGDDSKVAYVIVCEAAYAEIDSGCDMGRLRCRTDNKFS